MEAYELKDLLKEDVTEFIHIDRSNIIFVYQINGVVFFNYTTMHSSF
jgi:hypothetical protein